MLNELSDIDGLIFGWQEDDFMLLLHFKNKIKWVFMVGFILYLIYDVPKVSLPLSKLTLSSPWSNSNINQILLCSLIK